MTNEKNRPHGGRGEKKSDGAVEAPYGEDQDRTTGQSGGGSYPNPHSKSAARDKQGSFTGHGGQSEIRYYGGADKEAAGKAKNGVTQKEE